LSPDVRDEFERHVTGCDECRRAAALIAQERVVMKAVLGASVVTEGTDEADSVRLASYLSGALSDVERESVEARLAAEPAYLTDLIRIQDETLATLAEVDAPGVELEQPKPAGEILRMPKRTTLPVTVVGEGWDIREGSGG